MVIKTSWPEKVFSSQIPDIVLTSDKTRVHISISVDEDVIYEENLFPDTASNIIIGEIDELVMPFARKKLVAPLKAELQEQTVVVAPDGAETITTNSTATLTTSFIYCTAEVSESAQSFSTSHYLSRLQGTKITAVGRLEYLHYDSKDAATITATYDDGTTAAFNAVVIGGTNYYTTIDVSPARFVADGKTLVSYVVTAGQRTQQFDIDFTIPDSAPTLLFTNCFGCQELVYCTGLHSVAPEFKYSSTFIRGRLHNYDIQEKRLFSADTGFLTFPMADWLSDLFRSDEIYIVNFVNGQPNVGRMIVITDQNSEYSNADDEMPRFKFSYIYADRNHNVIDISRGGRIFDNTFDNTFN